MKYETTDPLLAGLFKFSEEPPCSCCGLHDEENRRDPRGQEVWRLRAILEACWNRLPFREKWDVLVNDLGVVPDDWEKWAEKAREEALNDSGGP